jgi:hypothetical protein
MKYLLIIITILIGNTAFSEEPKKMKDFAGTYLLETTEIVDLDKLTTEKQERSVGYQVKLTIGKDGSIVYGAGKSHKLELVRELEHGYAYYIEKNKVGKEVYVTKYCIKVTEKYFILYSYPLNGKLAMSYYKR